jgi:hypothetical protein
LVVTQTYSPGLVSAWIDFDQNGDFGGTGEYLGSYAVYNWGYDQSGTINFNVPNGASTGNTRMRIRTTYVYWYNNGYDPCNTENYGETEDYTVNITAASGQTYSSSNNLQANSNNASLGTNDQEVLKIQVLMCGSSSPLNLTSANFDLSSCTNLGDITNAKLYYTGSSNTFSTSTLVGSTSSISNSISISGTQTLAGGVNNFWLAYDVPSTGTMGDQLCASCTNINVGGNNYTPSGSTQCRTIDYCNVTAPMYGYWNMINYVTVDGNTQYLYCYNYYCNQFGTVFYGDQGSSVLNGWPKHLWQ